MLLPRKPKLITRRKLITTAAASIIAAPAIVRADLLVNPVFVQEATNDDLILWLRGDLNVGSTGTPVNTWTDQSIYHNDATGHGTTTSPTIQAADRNSLNTMRFTCSDKQYYSLPDFISPYNQGFVIWVAKVLSHPTAAGCDAGITKFGADVTTNGNNHYGFSGDGHIYDDFGTFTRSDLGQAGSNLITYHMFSMQSAQPTSLFEAYLNGTLFYSNLNTSVPWTFGTVPFIGRGRRDVVVPGTENYLDAWIAELLVYRILPSSGFRMSVESYLTAKWGPF